MKYLIMLVLLASLSACGKCKGDKGDVGNTGATGQNGSNGVNGVDGNGCTTTALAPGSVGAPNGGALIICGSTSTVILNGTNGTNGVNGTNGSNAIMNMVQFCNGFTQTYPSVFAESGFCVGNDMYGVYSANGGFLAKLPPGTYGSSGINSSCTFTITPQCTVQ
jgi:hypothetical protein